jgi:hypothetical protein
LMQSLSVIYGLGNCKLDEEWFNLDFENQG